MRLSSASFSGGGVPPVTGVLLAQRKSVSNPYVLAAAVMDQSNLASSSTAIPLCATRPPNTAPVIVGPGFDKSETRLFRKHFFRFKKKEPVRRNTVSGSNALTELLSADARTKLGRALAVDDAALDAERTEVVRKPRTGSVIARVQPLAENVSGLSVADAEIEVNLGYVKGNGGVKYRYVFSKMNEGRKTQVILLDETTVDIVVQPKQFASELLDLVSSRFNLKEKDYFGLAFIDETNHYSWLQLDRRVLDHEIPKRSGPLVLYFSIRFFIESIAYLRYAETVELFYRQARQAIYRERIECTSSVVFDLAALVLQEIYSDYADDTTARKHLAKLSVLSTSTFKEHPSISYCEDQVIERYKKLSGRSRGASIVSYMTIVESLPTYGVHYYEVKDKAGMPWWLGLSYSGISLYDIADKKTPRRVFPWKQLENLYFRDKKFSIEVHDPKHVVHTLSNFNLYEDAIREPLEDFDELSDAISDPTTQVSVSRRTFGAGNVNVHAWLAATAQLTKSIWSMAVSQHQFYLDRKQSKSLLQSMRTPSEMAFDLCQNTSSVVPTTPTSSSSSSSAGVMTHSISAQSLPTVSLHSNTKSEFGSKELESSRLARLEAYAALKARKEELEEKLIQRLEKLRHLCLQESEITGELPKDYPMRVNESHPAVRKRIGTSFAISPPAILRSDSDGISELLSLEKEYEVQDKIVKAAQRLANDPTIAKNVRRTRQTSYDKEQQKLAELGRKVHECRRRCIGSGGSKKTVYVQSFSAKDYFSPSNSPVAERPSPIGRSESQPAYMSQAGSSQQQEFHNHFPHKSGKPLRTMDDNRLSSKTSTSGSSDGARVLPQPKSAPSSPIRQFYNRHALVNNNIASPGPMRNTRTGQQHYDASDEPMIRHHSNGHNDRIWIPASDASRHQDRYPHDDQIFVGNNNNVYNNVGVVASIALTPSHNGAGWPQYGARVTPRHDMSMGRHSENSIAGTDTSPAYTSVDLSNHSRPPSVDSYYRHRLTQPFYNDNISYSTPVMTSGADLTNVSSINNNYSGINLSDARSTPDGVNDFSLSAYQHHAHRMLLSPSLNLSHSRHNFHTSSSSPAVQYSAMSQNANSSGALRAYEGINLSLTETSSLSSEQARNITEVSKPFEMSDFYKYSERLRRQQRHTPESPLRAGSVPLGSPRVSHHHAGAIVVGVFQADNNEQQTTHSAENLYRLQRLREQLAGGAGGRGMHMNGAEVRKNTGVRTPGPHAVRQQTSVRTFENSMNNRSLHDASFGSFHTDSGGVAQAFGEEMLAWYNNKDPPHPSVPLPPPDEQSTLV